jgi:hypothetical protein
MPAHATSGINSVHLQLKSRRYICICAVLLCRSITATREPLWRQIVRVLQEGWEVNIALLAASAVLITILILRTTFTSAAVQANPRPYIFYVSGQAHYRLLTHACFRQP